MPRLFQLISLYFQAFQGKGLETVTFKMIPDVDHFNLVIYNYWKELVQRGTTKTSILKNLDNASLIF